MIDEDRFALLVEVAVRKVVREELAKLAQGPEYVTIAEACAISGRGDSTVRGWLREGELGRYGKGRAVRIKRVELLALMDSLKTEARSLTSAEADRIAAEIVE